MKENNPLQIKELLKNYCSENLGFELNRYVALLFDTIIQTPLMDINRGNPQIWAASIVYVIARLNFLFDKENEDYISFDEICSYFEVKKSTIGNKATQIEKAYGIEFADKKYTKPEIYKSFEFQISPEGFAVPSFLLKSVTGKEAEEIQHFVEDQKLVEQQRLEKKKARRTEINRKIGEDKKKKNKAGQISLFD
ncbi:MAG: DUF6398 domain-containing protein [Spirochaetia bacterium]|jgi:hypothetical protein|nr:DUF6398 domain-containing protein [Spirochaetia bacterium]